MAGGIFEPNPPKIGHGVSVPKANFKLITVLKVGQTANDVTDSTEVIAVVMLNEPGVGTHRWTEFVTSVDEVETRTGYDFLARAPDEVEQVIEGRVAAVR